MPYRFQISANLLTWPRNCACCGGQADSQLRASASRTTGKRVQRTTTSSWEVPYCSRCVRHKSMFDSAKTWLMLGAVAAIIAWIAVVQSASGGAGFIVGSVVFGLSLLPYNAAQARARGHMLPSCCTPAAAVQYLEWHGSFHTFVFNNRAYLDSFLAANDRKKRSDITPV
jgi:hypothetical protein